jgi:hypothetical protein
MPPRSSTPIQLFPQSTLTIGPQIGSMTNSDILDLLNATIEAQDRLAAEYDHALIEIPPGRPQIRFHEGSEQWVPRGDVLRCHIEDDEAGEVVVYVDDQELSLHLLRTYAGWACAFRSCSRTAWPFSLRLK